MNISLATRHLRKIVEEESNCNAGIAAQRFVVGMEIAPSGGPELLVTVHVDDPFWGFWYGHILQHPQKTDTFVALIVWTDKFINAPRVPLLFQRFHYWIRERLSYQPCAVQAENDAYEECSSLKRAVFALERMIRCFDIRKRAAYEGTGFENCPFEGRIVEIYGLGSDADDGFSKWPAFMNLALVRNQE
ncbi:hypothetical protein ACTOWA_20830 [Herbaspirillum seropedicae]|uniref:hypothetical protein n=1 Tax=Herbaspirillum seropedicae TaxID=964 RepID=UPI003F8D0ED0